LQEENGPMEKEKRHSSVNHRRHRSGKGADLKKKSRKNKDGGNSGGSTRIGVQTGRGVGGRGWGFRISHNGGEGGGGGRQWSRKKQSNLPTSRRGRSYREKNVGGGGGGLSCFKTKRTNRREGFLSE